MSLQSRATADCLKLICEKKERRRSGAYSRKATLEKISYASWAWGTQLQTSKLSIILAFHFIGNLSAVIMKFKDLSSYC